VQKILFRLERDLLAPYELAGNRISRDMYDKLQLPWDVSTELADVFPREQFVRKEWDRDGVLSAQGPGRDFFGGGEFRSLDKFASGLSTASMVTRWRAAHPDLVGTSEDVVEVTIRDLREALGGQAGFVAGCGTALLLLKKKCD
jgi:trans-aconitate 3-methyltransferase